MRVGGTDSVRPASQGVNGMHEAFPGLLLNVAFCTHGVHCTSATSVAAAAGWAPGGHTLMLRHAGWPLWLAKFTPATHGMQPRLEFELAVPTEQAYRSHVPTEPVPVMPVPGGHGRQGVAGFRSSSVVPAGQLRHTRSEVGVGFALMSWPMVQVEMGLQRRGRDERK